MASGFRRNTDSLPTCMNCGSVLYGAFCSHCGQRTAQPITLRSLGTETWDRLRRLDFPWIRTVVDLTTDPGDTARRYLKGRRLPYVGPILYAVTATSLLASLAMAGAFDLSAPSTPWSASDARSSNRTFAIAALATLVVTWLVAWLQRELFRDREFSWTETWLFDLYLFGHLAFHQAIFALLGAYASLVGLAALGLVVVLVVSFALGGFYRRPVIQTIPAATILSAIYIGGVWSLAAAARILFGL